MRPRLAKRRLEGFGVVGAETAKPPTAAAATTPRTSGKPAPKRNAESTTLALATAPDEPRNRKRRTTEAEPVPVGSKDKLAPVASWIARRLPPSTPTTLPQSLAGNSMKSSIVSPPCPSTCGALRARLSARSCSSIGRLASFRSCWGSRDSPRRWRASNRCTSRWSFLHPGLQERRRREA